MHPVFWVTTLPKSSFCGMYSRSRPELIRKPSDLLRVLLRRHYREQRIPTILDERFIQVLRQNDDFEGWPLDSIIPDREVFFSFLQERWPIFLDRSAKKDGLEIRDSKDSLWV